MDYHSHSPSTIYVSTTPAPSDASYLESRTVPTTHTTPTSASTTPTATECARHFISDLASNASVRLLQPPPPAGPCNVTLLDEAGGSAEPFLFDRGDVRGVLITLYTVVFITGFVGFPDAVAACGCQCAVLQSTSAQHRHRFDCKGSS
ncbi:hypothetical protein E2C01_035135 [Portunus trituberculatus]|uniref:Uncharacterized protein n=1 Tax=Portunus trituberculatus TaxID=210409 RepID=A0A5B7F8C0_PORTR|nr:hypothetical protein [Portunus trituberculatus]